MTAVAVRWFLSRHALERMAEMGIERPEVCAVLDDPVLTYTDAWGRFHSQAGRLDVVLGADDPDVVVTVLWRTDEDYRRGGETPALRRT